MKGAWPQDMSLSKKVCPLFLSLINEGVSSVSVSAKEVWPLHLHLNKGGVSHVCVSK